MSDKGSVTVVWSMPADPNAARSRSHGAAGVTINSGAVLDRVLSATSIPAIRGMATRTSKLVQKGAHHHAGDDRHA